MPIVVKTPGKVKTGRAKGHYLYRVSNEDDRPIEERKYSTASRRTAQPDSQKAEGDEQFRKSSVISEETISQSQARKGVRVLCIV